MIKTAVILAAGKGNRLNKITNYKSKPLTELFGRTFIERAILNLRNNLKIENFIIVTGYNNQESEQYLDQLKQKYNLNLSCIYDPDWEKGNGHTFLAALNNTNEDQFYLQMVDHLFTDKFYQVILNTKISNNKSYLLVSKNLSKYHDYEDVTKVKIENNYINNIDKSIEKPDAYDAGFFIIDIKNYDTNIFFNFNKVELSKVHMSVADKQNLLPIYVEHSDWMDVDTEKDLKKAEDSLKEFQENHKMVALPEQTLAAIEAAAALKAQMLSNEVKLGVMLGALNTNHPDIENIKKENSELSKKMNELEYGTNVIGYKKSNLFPVLADVPELGVELVRLKREVEIQNTLFVFLTQQYEEAKIKEAKDTPTVQILDYPQIPQLKSAPKRVLILIFCIIITFFVNILFILYKSEKRI